MNTFTKKYVRQFKKEVGKFSRVLEVGSLDVNGTIRPYFSDADEYIGIDLFAGKSVDLVASSYEIPKYFERESFDLVICLDTLEHDPFFWVTVRNMRWVLKPKGWMIIATPSLRHKIHQYPKDYYRFLPDVYELCFFNGFELCKGAVGFPKRIPLDKIVPEEDILEVCYSGRKPENFKENIFDKMSDQVVATGSFVNTTVKEA